MSNKSPSGHYLGNENTKELHDLNKNKPQCQIYKIKNSKPFSRKQDAKKEGYDFCAWCIGNSKR